MSAPLSDMFQILSQWPKTSVRARKKSPKACPQCRWTLDLFQKTGKMGCGVCYSFFHKELAAVLKKIHGQFRHIGKKPGSIKRTPARPPTKARKSSRSVSSLAALKNALAKAVKEERFEEAALLRDEIRKRECPNS